MLLLTLQLLPLLVPFVWKGYDYRRPFSPALYSPYKRAIGVFLIPWSGTWSRLLLPTLLDDVI